MMASVRVRPPVAADVVGGGCAASEGGQLSQPRGSAVNPAGGAIANSAAAIPVAGGVKVVVAATANRAGWLDVFVVDATGEPH